MGDNTYRVNAGIDWANEIHQVFAADAEGRKLGERKVPHSGAELHAMADWLVSLAGGQPDAVGVAIEVPHGAIVDTLLDRGCHVYLINPKQLDRFRDRLFASGAKDDRRDAQVASSALRTDRDRLRRLHTADPLTLELREASRDDAELGEDLVRLTNRLRDQLLRVWPEMLRLSPAADEPWFWRVLIEAPIPSAAKELPTVRVSEILREYRIRRVTPQQVVEVLQAQSVYVAPGVREGVAPRIVNLLEQISVVYPQRREAERRLKKTLEAIADDTPTEKVREHQDVVILQSLPGIGTRIAATVLAEAPQAMRERDYHALRMKGGIAPVTKQSGKSLMVLMRKACNDRLRFALRCWAMGAIQHDAHSRAHYDRLRKAGKTHDRALRGVVDRLLSVLIAMLRDGTLYDATKRGCRDAVAA